MNCCKCGHDIPEGQDYCQFCGFNNASDEKENKAKSSIIVVFVVIGMAILIGVVILIGLHQKKEQERQVLEVLNKSNLSEEIEDSYNQFNEDVEDINSEIDKKQ